MENLDQIKRGWRNVDVVGRRNGLLKVKAHECDHGQAYNEVYYIDVATEAVVGKNDPRVAEFLATEKAELAKFASIANDKGIAHALRETNIR